MLPAGFTIALLMVIGLAVVFDYINGFHDTANAIATSVATRALRPVHALGMAAAFNFIGAFAGTAVATTIGAGLVDEKTTTQAIVAAALVGAIAWNLITWAYGVPSSSSHALIGGLVGATIAGAGSGAVRIDGLVGKVLVPMVTSPILGFVIAFGVVVILYRVFRRSDRRPASAGFRRAQVLSAGYMAFAHGSNDAQKTMGIITLALFSARVIPSVDVPIWVIVVSASALSLGTAVGGWRIMKTMGQRVADLE
ncbi:MAG: inorganic phosphate transporter, partial [Candidatus Limnocylindrales bacterium]